MNNADKTRTCFNCNHTGLCYVKRNLEQAVRLAPINIDSNDAPLQYLDLFVALANTCFEYKRMQPND